MRIITGDNLETLKRLADENEKFDLVELDGPYSLWGPGSGLEKGWDELGENDYLIHYATRLALVREILQPWGAVFMFGYPEGCAEVKAWARQTGTLYLRRWLHWHKHQTAHAGRKIEVILFFLRGNPTEEETRRFGLMLKTKREARGWTLMQVEQQAESFGAARPWWHRGGNLYFETGSGGAPSPDDLQVLSKIFDFDPEPWAHVVKGSYEGITEVDLIQVADEKAAVLNENGLRSKPIQLYTQLFRPVIPTTPHPRALILYGGSGNAGIAAEALGYDVTLCELDPRRAEAIQKRAEKLVPQWRAKHQARQAQRSIFTADQAVLF